MLVDPLEPGLSLEPLYDLFRARGPVKVFHAARQDLEIFQVDAWRDPVAAVRHAGRGDGLRLRRAGGLRDAGQASIAKAQLDKSSRFTDWSRRPLTDAQKTYALADVTHLRQIYEYLDKRLQETGRERWVAEELPS